MQHGARTGEAQASCSTAQDRCGQKLQGKHTPAAQRAKHAGLAQPSWHWPCCRTVAVMGTSHNDAHGPKPPLPPLTLTPPLEVVPKCPRQLTVVANDSCLPSSSTFSCAPSPQLWTAPWPGAWCRWPPSVPFCSWWVCGGALPCSSGENSLEGWDSVRLLMRWGVRRCCSPPCTSNCIGGQSRWGPRHHQGCEIKNGEGGWGAEVSCSSLPPAPFCVWQRWTQSQLSPLWTDQMPVPRAKSNFILGSTCSGWQGVAAYVCGSQGAHTLQLLGIEYVRSGTWQR